MLTLNISEVISTVICFFLLLFLLNKFLYKPVISFREKRDARIAAGHKADADAQASIAANDERLRAEREKASAEAKLSVANAKAADEKTYNDVVAASKLNEPQALKQMHAEVSAERDKLTKELDAKEAELTDALAKRILSGN